MPNFARALKMFRESKLEKNGVIFLHYMTEK